MINISKREWCSSLCACMETSMLKLLLINGPKSGTVLYVIKRKHKLKCTNRYVIFFSTPTGLEDVSRYPMLLAELARDRQWSSTDLKKLAGANLVRVFREVEKASHVI